MTVKQLIHQLQSDYRPNAEIVINGRLAEEAVYESFADTIPEEEYNRYSTEELNKLHFVIR